MTQVMLCADSVSAQYPECLGLDGEQLFSQSWLQVLSDAKQVRINALANQPEEIWIAGSDEVDAINLAATLKQDGVPGKVRLLAFQGNGSLLSRAQAARIDAVWDKQTFLQQYQKVKDSQSSKVATENLHNPAATGKHALVTTGERTNLSNNIQLVKSEQRQIKSLSADVAYLLSVVGAGGGVGKSSIAVVAAYLAQSKGYRTVLVDADLQFGDISYLTGRDDGIPFDELVNLPARVNSIDCSGRLPALVSAPLRLEHSEEVAAMFPQVIQDLQRRFEVVVVNTSPAWSDTQLQLLEAGGNALFVLDQRPSSIRACKHVLELCARCGVATQPIVFALNRCSRQSLFSSIDVTCALKGAHVVELAEGGRDVEELLGTGAPLELIDSGNALCQSVARVLADLLPERKETLPAQIVLPPKKRFRFNPKRKKAACL